MIRTQVVYFYKYHLRSSRKIVSRHTYYEKKNYIKKINNKALMFVRAPKHFKSGKQFLVFFNGVYLEHLNFCTPKYFFFFNSFTLFNLLQKIKTITEGNDIMLHKIKLTSKITIKF